MKPYKNVWQGIEETTKSKIADNEAKAKALESKQDIDIGEWATRHLNILDPEYWGGTKAENESKRLRRENTQLTGSMSVSEHYANENLPQQEMVESLTSHMPHRLQ
jgi:hypothetical protein